MWNCNNSCYCQGRCCDYYYDYPQQNTIQAQAQAQDQDQNLRTIIRDIGNSNVNITVDNENILVAVLVLVEVLLGGALDTSALQTYLDRRVNSADRNQ